MKTYEVYMTIKCSFLVQAESDDEELFKKAEDIIRHKLMANDRYYTEYDIIGNTHARLEQED